MFAGPNGSGKSSVRDRIANPAELVIDPDRIAREISPAAPRSVDPQAGRIAVQRFEEGLAAGKSISMETTLTGHSAVQRLRRAKAAGYEVTLIYVALEDPELNVRRVAARVRQGGHAIDPDVVRKRVGDSMGNLPRALALADQAIVMDNSGATHRRVLELAEGRVTFLAERLPQWLQDRMPAIGAELLRAAAGPAVPGASPAVSPQRGLVSPILDALRTPDTTPPPWQPAPVSMAERIRAFEERAAKAAQDTKPDPSTEQGPEMKPSRGPRP